MSIEHTPLVHQIWRTTAQFICYYSWRTSSETSLSQP